jgi:alanine dehydrogenase
MLIGVPKEVKTHEYRVGLVPGNVRELVHHGHAVIVETGAGAGIGFDDASYETAGAGIAAYAERVFAAAEMIVKVKEPQPREVAALGAGQILFTYSTSPRTSRWPKDWFGRALSRSPMKRSPTLAADCRFSPR